MSLIVSLSADLAVNMESMATENDVAFGQLSSMFRDYLQVGCGWDSEEMAEPMEVMKDDFFFVDRENRVPSNVVAFGAPTTSRAGRPRTPLSDVSNVSSKAPDRLVRTQMRTQGRRVEHGLCRSSAGNAKLIGKPAAPQNGTGHARRMRLI